MKENHLISIVAKIDDKEDYVMDKSDGWQLIARVIVGGFAHSCRPLSLGVLALPPVPLTPPAFIQSVV